MALGDSISTDDYPGEGKGAASLFYKNPDHLHPDFSGKDLKSVIPGIEFVPLASDGATSSDVLHKQLTHLHRIHRKKVLFTLTAGGNDIMTLLDEADEISLRIRTTIQLLQEKFNGCLILLGTVYDPSDGYGDLFDTGAPLERELRCLKALNESIRNMQGPGVEVVDIHKHFLGHGNHCKDPENPFYNSHDPSLWYVLNIEPNSRGAHEIRKLFWSKFETCVKQEVL